MAKYWKLPGGRYGGITARGKRFIVDSLAKARAKLGKRRKSKKTRTSNPKKTTKKGKRSMGKRKRRRGGKSMTRTAFKLIRLGALAAPALIELTRSGPMDQKIRRAFTRYTGYDVDTGQFHPEYLAIGWGPYLMACLTTYGIPKVTSIIRRL